MADIHDNIELSDSDDDLLGITDTPIDIHSRLHNHDYFFSIHQLSSDIRTPFHDPTFSSTSIRNKKFSPMKSNKFLTEPSQSYSSIHPCSSSILQQNSKFFDDGWIHCGRHRKPKNYTRLIQAPSLKSNTNYIFDNWTNQESNKNFPESSDNLSESHNPYHKSINAFIRDSNQPRKDFDATYVNPPKIKSCLATVDFKPIDSESNNTIRTDSYLENIIPVKSSAQVESQYLSPRWNTISHNSNDSFCNSEATKQTPFVPSSFVASYKNDLTKCGTDNSSYGLPLKQLGHPKGCYVEIQSTPTMEIIDINNSKMEMKQNRYQRMREIRGVIGFIVNVHDATNFDIDLEISPDLHEKYRDVISNQYTYQDLDLDFLENPNLNRTTEITPKIGTTYRCRLRGVGINQLAQNVHTWKSNQMCVEVKQLIDRTDGWIICTLSDIDVYQRLLVDILINTSNGPINLRDYLLSRMEHEDNPIFYPYSSKREGRDRKLYT